jgi:hypothetical protein
MNTLEFCENYLKNVDYTINSDDTIDVDGYVNLDGKLGNMEKLPVKFGKVSGYFNCFGNKLTTLEGCPKYVGSGFGSDILTHHILGNVQGSIFTNKKQRIVI